MKNSLKSVFFFIALLSFCSCRPQGEAIDETQLSEVREASFVATVQKHLHAVSHRDIATLKSTMHPDGKMQLLLPATEIINGVDGFMKYHEEWFKATDWTFETNILNTEIGSKLGLAVVEVVYREPERDGVPYFNRMVVSYDLELVDGRWYFIKDHASSIEKSTDES